MTYDEIERLAYIKGDGQVAMLAANAADVENLEADFEERLADSFEEGKLNASDAELLAEIESLKAQLKQVRVAMIRVNTLVSVTCDLIDAGKLSTIKERKEFKQKLRADQRQLNQP